MPFPHTTIKILYTLLLFPGEIIETVPGSQGKHMQRIPAVFIIHNACVIITIRGKCYNLRPLPACGRIPVFCLHAAGSLASACMRPDTRLFRYNRGNNT